MQIFIAFLIALMTTMVLTPPLIRWAHSMNVLDLPNERKVHQSAVPRVGGVAMVLATLLSILILLPLEVEILALILGISILMVFGIYDDLSDLGYRTKFFGQFAAATIVVFFGNVLLAQLPLMGLDPQPSYITAPLSILFIVGVTNAVNLADGLDGLAAGSALLSLAAIALLAYLADGLQLLLITVAVIGCIFGFLRYNTFPARVFMGDTGSQFLGFSVGALAVLLTQQTNTALSAVLPLFILGLPLLDTAMVMGQRIGEGRSPFAPDKKHIHHKLLDLGFYHYEAVVLIYLVQAIFVLCGIFLRYESDLLLILLYFGMSGTLVFSLRHAMRSGWKVHKEGGAPRVRSILRAVDRSDAVREMPLLVLKYGVALLLGASVLFVRDVPLDVGIGASVIFFLMLLRLVYGYRLWFLFLRLLVFITAAFVVYLTGMYPAGTELYPGGLEYVYYGTLACALMIAIRYSKEEVFSVTPTDYLLALLVFGLAVVPHEQLIEYRLLQSIVKMAILFYSSELIMRRMENRWNGFTIIVLLSLGVMGVRGLIL